MKIQIKFFWLKIFLYECINEFNEYIKKLLKKLKKKSYWNKQIYDFYYNNNVDNDNIDERNIEIFIN